MDECRYCETWCGPCNPYTPAVMGKTEADLRARVAELEAQVAGQQRVMENAIATLRKSLARRPSAAIHEVVFTLTAFLRSRSQP